MGRPKIYTDAERLIRDDYNNHRTRALRRGIEFHLTLQEWVDIWQSSGHWHKRGVRRDEYVMARLGPDIGPYAVGNVVIQISGQNNSDGHKGKSFKQNLTAEQRLERSRRMSAWRKGKTPWNKGIKNV